MSNPNPVTPNDPASRPAAAHDEVAIHYTTRTPDGGIVETSRNRDPFRFRVGSDEVVHGVNALVVGMRVGEKRSATVPPEQAFGAVDPELRVNVPPALVPDWAESEDQFTAHVAGCELDVWLTSRSAEGAVLDANHPLAGRTLVYDIEVVSVTPGEPLEEIVPQGT